MTAPDLTDFQVSYVFQKDLTTGYMMCEGQRQVSVPFEVSHVQIYWYGTHAVDFRFRIAPSFAGSGVRGYWRIPGAGRLALMGISKAAGRRYIDLFPSGDEFQDSDHAVVVFTNIPKSG